MCARHAPQRPRGAAAGGSVTPTGRRDAGGECALAPLWEGEGGNDPPTMPEGEAHGCTDAATAAPYAPGYDVQQRIGEGGMGTVWRAVQLGTGRPVALKLMNNVFVDSRIGPNNGSRVQSLLLQNANAQTIIRELFLNTLSRPPSADELSRFTTMFQQQGNRSAAESLQWVLLNKMDFVFNY